jgi:hypothetical protein
MTLTNEKSTTVATINNVQIVVVDQNQNYLVPIRPICEALGISFSKQLRKLKEDEFYNSVVSLRATTGADGKTYKISHLPLKYTLLWLGSINQANVAEDAREAVIKYKEACADALYRFFMGYKVYDEFRQAKMDEITAKQKEARHEFATAKTTIKRCNEEMEDILSLSYDEFLNDQFQYSLFKNEE